MTGNELKRIRDALGLTQRDLADWLGFERRQGAKRIREMEDDRRTISPSVATCMAAFMAGWRPDMDDVTAPLQRVADAVSGLLVECSSAQAAAQKAKASGSLWDAANKAGEASGLARAGNVLSRVLAEVVALSERT